MDAGFRGTFVISWSQTELDGQWSPSPQEVSVGRSWNWTGEAIRVDGPGHILTLGDGAEAASLRQRAAQGVQRLLHLAERRAAGADRPADPITPDLPPPFVDQSMTVTDGTRSWTLTLIQSEASGVPLLMALGEVPPADEDLWIVSHTMDAAVVHGAPRDTVPGGVICFTPGTLIATREGLLPVEEVTPGTLVQTKDNGLAEVQWTGNRRITGARLHVMPHLAPVRFRAGALDAGVPDPGLLVSPDHRVLVRGPRARALFNADEVLVAARDLVNDHSILIERPRREVTYIHLLLPRHEIIFANGVETESFHPAGAALDTMDPAQLGALRSVLPGGGEPQDFGPYARRVLSRSEALLVSHDVHVRH